MQSRPDDFVDQIPNKSLLTSQAWERRAFYWMTLRRLFAVGAGGWLVVNWWGDDIADFIEQVQSYISDE